MDLVNCLQFGEPLSSTLAASPNEASSRPVAISLTTKLANLTPSGQVGDASSQIHMPAEQVTGRISDRFSGMKAHVYPEIRPVLSFHELMN